MHTLDVHLQLLRLTEFASAKVAQRFRSLRIRTTTVSAMHFQIIQSEEELLAELALVGAFAVVLFDSVLHDVVFSDEGSTADLLQHENNIAVKIRKSKVNYVRKALTLQ